MTGPGGDAPAPQTPRELGIAPPGFRMPADLRLGPVRLQVADLERSVAWYGRVLGLEATEAGAAGASLAPAGASEPLIELAERPGAAPVPRRGRLGLFHFALLLPDRPSLGRFIRHLDALGERAGMSDHLVSEAVYLYDPDGLGIEIYADRPRSGWVREGRELVMTTEPLDVDSVREAAGETPWRGMPAGAAMGHLHLFVGDLEAAAGFYHRALGLDKVVWSYPGALFLSAGGYHHHLGTNVWAAGAPPAGEDDARLLEWEIRMGSDAAAGALASVSAAGGPVERVPDGGVVRDPWGTALRIRAG